MLVAASLLQLSVAAPVPNGEDARPGDASEDKETMSQPTTSHLEKQPLAKLQRRGIRQYMEEQGIGVQEIPKALVVYEVISMTLLCVLYLTCLC